MSELGPSYEKYNRPEDEEKENDLGVADEGAERVMGIYDSIADKLSNETRKKLGPIITLIEKSYDPEDEDWTEFMTDVDFLLSEFEDAADDEEREQAQFDAQDELDHLVIRSEKLKK